MKNFKVVATADLWVYNTENFSVSLFNQVTSIFHLGGGKINKKFFWAYLLRTRDANDWASKLWSCLVFPLKLSTPENCLRCIQINLRLPHGRQYIQLKGYFVLSAKLQTHQKLCFTFPRALKQRLQRASVKLSPCFGASSDTLYI